LKERSWLTQVDDVYLLNPELLIMVGTVAYPSLVLVVIRDVPDRGQQEFIYYRSDRAIVEFTMPAGGGYRLATLPNLETTLARVRHVLTEDENVEPARDFAFTMDQEAFFRVKDLMVAGDRAAAATLLDEEGVVEPTARALLDAMERPRLSGTVAALLVADDTAIDARNVATLIGAGALWVFRQEPPGATTIAGRTLDRPALENELADQLVSLIESPLAA
jgi:hypothetical protein